MPPKKEQKSKEQKALAAMSSARSKQKKKKWAKGAVKDKKENVVVFDQALYNKVAKEISRMKIITIAALSERYQVSGSLARRAILAFEEEVGTIKIRKAKNKLD